MIKSNQYNHLTAKEREILSFPAKLLLNKTLLVGDVLDFGCGFGKDVEILREKGISIVGYDKHYFPEYPVNKFDTIICFYVLNVLMPEEQALVLMEISQMLKPTGKAYFAVRRDVQYEGFRTHKIHQKPTYQCNVILGYKSILKNENCEIYEYKHYNQLSRKGNTGCPFCNPDLERELLLESATAYSIFDKFPVSKGHTLIIPKKHCADYFELTFKEQSACWFMLNKAKEILNKELNPNGFNVGININETAGQTVPHVHIHLIPRYEKDVINPLGGIRNVIPSKGDYINQKSIKMRAKSTIKQILKEDAIKARKLFDLCHEKGEGLFDKLHIIEISSFSEEKMQFRVYHADGYCFDVEKEKIELSEDESCDSCINNYEYYFNEGAYEGFKEVSVEHAIKLIEVI